MHFQNRHQAGRQLGSALARYRGRDVVVVGMPRGGIPIAAEVADALGAPLDLMASRKLRAPSNPEFAIGAVTARGTRALNGMALRFVLLPPGYLDAEAERERLAAADQEVKLRGSQPAQPLAGKVVILVDDGVATGMSARAAIADLRAQSPAHLVVAAPVVAPGTYETLDALADEVVALEVPAYFYAVGQFYDDFTPVDDDEVLLLLASRQLRQRPPIAPDVKRAL